MTARRASVASEDQRTQRRARSLLRRVRAEFGRVANPAKAAGMQSYMKSAMPYWGVPAPALRTACRTVFASVEFRSAREWRQAVLTLFREATHREERYAAITLAERGAARFEDMEALPVYEEMITTGAWWDIVDVLASHRLGALLEKHPKPMKRVLRRWSKSPNLWKRRSAILAQLGFKNATDLELLYDCIRPSLGSSEFFLQKAIGWALRQYAWTNAREVRRYVRQHHAGLSALSRREALKNCGERGKVREADVTRPAQ